MKEQKEVTYETDKNNLMVLIKINCNWYAIDSIAVIEVKKIASQDFYDVNIHTKCGKCFAAFENETFEAALDYRNEIINTIEEILKSPVLTHDAISRESMKLKIREVEALERIAGQSPPTLSHQRR